MIKNLIIALLLVTGFAGVAYAAPTWTFNVSLLPQTDNAFDLGSSSPSKVWKTLYVNTICLSADCKSAWPSGSGNSFAWPFTVTNYGVATGTTLGFTNGLLSTASSTINAPLRLPSLSAGLTGVSAAGLVYGGIPTTTATCSGTVSCSAFAVLGTSPITITGSGGGSGSGTVSTSTTPTKGQLAVWTTSGAYPELLGSVATSAPTLPAYMTYVGGTLGSFVNGTAGTFSINSLPIANGGTATTTFRNNGVVFYSSVLGTLSQSTTTNGLDFDRVSNLLTVSKQSSVQTPISGSIAQFVGIDANPLRLTFDTHNNANTSGTAFMFRRSRGTSATPLAVQQDDVIGSLNFRGYGTTAYPSGSTALMTAKAEGVFTDTSMATALTFDTTATTSVTATERVRISGAGNVGIASTSPNQKLVIAGKVSIDNGAASEIDFGGGASANVLYSGSTATNGDLNFTSPNSFRLIGANGAAIFLQNSTKAQFGGTYEATASLFMTNGGFLSLGATSTPWAQLSVNPLATNNAAPSFVVGSSTATSFVITNAGRVGIGTSTPGTLLGVQGVANFNTGTSTFTATGGLNLTAGCFAINNVCVGSSSGGSAPGGTGTELQYRSGASTFGAITPSAYNAGLGLVGIGTTTPQWLLTLASSTGPQLTLTDGSLSSPGINFRNINGNFFLSTSSPSTYATNTQPVLSITSSTTGALLGVNIGTPRATLDLFETAGVGASPSIILGGNAGGDTDAWISRVTNNDAAAAGDFLRIGTTTVPNQGTLWTLDLNAGTEGLGTTSPYANLSINANGLPTTGIGSAYFAIGSTTSEVFRIGAAGSVGAQYGLGTTSPFATMSINATSSQTAFAVGSSTQTYALIDKFGHWIFGGGTPSVSSCGTSPTVIGNDQSGQVTIGSGAVSACTITFKAAWTVAPVCTANFDSTAATATVATLNVSNASLILRTTVPNIGGGKLNYICLGR